MKDEDQWEIVDHLPDEKPPGKKSGSPLLRRRALWVGVGIGCLMALLPPFRILLMKLQSLWWLAVVLVGYFIWRRMNAGKRTRK